MGFVIEKDSFNACLIKAVRGGDDSASFLSSAQSALKNLWLDITVDFSGNPGALGVVMPHLLKLQQVIGSHQKTLSVTGVLGNFAPDTIDRLKSMGINVVDESARKPFVKSPNLQSPTHPPHQSPSLFAGLPADNDPPLPPAHDIESRFTDLRGRLAQGLKRKNFLENEKKIYTERIHSLTQGRDNWILNHDQIQALSELEAKILKGRETRNRLQKEVEIAMAEKQKQQDQAKTVTSEIKTDEKKRREILDKQIAELTKKQEKLRADYKKKADTRKERLARAAKP